MTGETGAEANARVRTVFLGSGTFAVPVLEVVVRHPRLQPVGVVTAPARPAGRARIVVPSAVGAAAATLDVPVLTPDRLRAPEAIAAIAALHPELLVLADYGRIVPAALLELPRHGALNLHPSLLPRHRGATPVPAAILEGDAETGVTLMRMDVGLDTGPVIAQVRHPLRGDEVAPELERVLALEAADLLAAALEGWLSGSLAARPQPVEGVSLTRPLRREDGRLDPTLPAQRLERQVRAYQPWPGAWVDTAAGRLAVLRAAVVPRGDATDTDAQATMPGTLVALAGGRGKRLAMTTVSGTLALDEVHPAGGRPMSGAEFLRGRPAILGTVAAPSGERAPEGAADAAG